MDYTYRRGDVCWFNDPHPSTDGTHVMHGDHPCVVVSDNGCNYNTDTVIIAMMTSNVTKRMYQGQFDVILDGRRSRVRCDQMRVVDKSCLDTPIATLSTDAIAKLDYAIRDICGLVTPTCPEVGLAEEED